MLLVSAPRCTPAAGNAGVYRNSLATGDSDKAVIEVPRATITLLSCHFSYSILITAACVV